MNTLLFDAGNSRFKWALVRSGHLGAQQAQPVAELDGFGTWLRRQPAIQRVVGVNVAGPRFERALRSLVHDASRPAPEFIVASREAAGVHNAYAEPGQLGADRWAALVAAWHRAGCYRTVCAASVGTALTLDLVDQDGYHRGGLIAPGPTLMRDALLGGTADIAARAMPAATRRRRRKVADKHGLVPPLADATRAAIEEGSLAAAAGFIDRNVNLLTRRLGVRPVLFITGGGADAVVKRLRSACKPSADLVLRGVAVLADVPLLRRQRKA
jgi:type III pantothenate kinase